MVLLRNDAVSVQVVSCGVSICSTSFTGTVMHVSAALKKSKERFENEMSEHGSARDMQTREAEATGRISGLERKIQYAEIEKV